jgi:hypothetical protein
MKSVDKVGCISVTAISNVVAKIQTKQVPILRAVIESVFLAFDGAIHPRLYVDNITLSIEMDVYNVKGKLFKMFFDHY